jgi:pilus assembly protein Flp/PilA
MLRILKDETGQGLSEYGMVLGVISIAAIALIAALSENVVIMLTNTVQILTGTDG